MNMRLRMAARRYGLFAFLALFMRAHWAHVAGNGHRELARVWWATNKMEDHR